MELRVVNSQIKGPSHYTSIIIETISKSDNFEPTKFEDDEDKNKFSL